MAGRTEEKGSFWERLFQGTERSARERRVLEYLIHRIQEGARLREVVEEPYVRRNASPDEVGEILSSPECVHSARERLERDFGVELDPASVFGKPAAKEAADSRRAL